MAAKLQEAVCVGGGRTSRNDSVREQDEVEPMSQCEGKRPGQAGLAHSHGHGSIT